MQHEPAHIDRTDEDRDLRGLHPDFGRKDRPHAELRSEDRAQEEGADAAQGRGLEELLQWHPPCGREDWRGAGRQQHRRKRDRDRDRHDDEQVIAPGIGHVDQALGNNDPQHLHDQIGRERPPPVLVGGAVVQPALGHHVDAGIAEADDDAHHRPGDRIDDGGEDDEGGRDQRAQRREDPHMADPAHQPGRDLRAAEEAGEVAGHDEAHGGGVERLDAAAQAQHGALHAVAEHQQEHAEQQRPGIADHCEHEAWLSKLEMRNRMFARE